MQPDSSHTLPLHAHEQDQHPIWEKPLLVEYDVVSATEITNCGNGSDGVICASASS